MMDCITCTKIIIVAIHIKHTKPSKTFNLLCLYTHYKYNFYEMTIKRSYDLNTKYFFLIKT